jgi:DNA-binding beta-propeller fold protein YncE
MFALLYLAVAVLAGDALGRRWFRYETVAHRWATAVLIAMPTASWLSYLLALPLGGVGDRLLVADILAGGILLVVVVWSWWRDRRSASRTEAHTRRAALDAWDALTIAAITLLVGWMMVSTYHVTDGRLGIATGLWSDFGPTSAIAQSFAVGDNFPTEYPHYAGEPIRYHFLYYFQVGNLTHLGFDPATANNVLSIGSLVAMLVLVMAMGRRLFGSAVVGRIGAALFFFHGALSFIPYVLNLGSLQRAAEVLPGLTSFMTTGFPFRGEEWGIWTQMVFLNQRHLASAIGILLVIVLFLLQRLRTRQPAHEAAEVVAEPPEAAPPEAPEPEAVAVALADVEPGATTLPAPERRAPRPPNPVGVVRQTVRDPFLLGFVLCGALAGMLPLWNGSIYVAAVALLGLWFVLFPNRPQMLVLAAAAGALSIPQLLWVRPGTMAGEQTYPSFFWGYVIDNPTVANVASYLAFVFGPKLLLAGVALLAASWRQWRVFIAFSGLVALAFVMQLSVEVLANHKFINAWLVVANLFAAAGLVRLWRARPAAVRIPARLVATALAATIVIGGVIDFIPVKNQGILEFGMDGDPLYEWVKNDTDPRSVFLSDIYVVNQILLAGREIYYGWPYYAWSAGYDVFPRESWYREVFANRSARQVAQQLNERGIDYVAIDDGVRRGTFATKVNEEIFERYFERSFSDDGSHANIAIYRVPTDPAAIAALPDTPAESMYVATAGDAPGSLVSPRGLAVEAAGTLLVADTGNDRVQRFSPDGNLLDVIGEAGTGPGQVDEPVGVAVDPGGRIYAADAGNRRIQQFDADGTFLQELSGPEGGFDTLADVAIEGNVLYAVDAGRGLARIELDTGSGTWTSPVDGPGRLVAPTGVAVRGGRVYVADMGSTSIVVFDEQGAFVEQWPVADWAASAAQVADVEVDTDGTVWATNPEHDTVIVFGGDGTQLGLLVPGDPDTLDGPAGIVRRPAGSLFVANFEGNRISLLTQTRP